MNKMTFTPLSIIERFLKTGPLADRRYLVLNTLCFQIAWLLCVLGGSSLAIFVTAAVVALHLQVVRDTKREALFLAQCAIIGFLCDLLLVQSGVMTTVTGWPPVWLTCLWVLFGTTVGYAMRFFHGRLWASVLGGAVFAPLSYFGGARLADVPLMQPEWFALVVIGLVWAFIFPLLIHLYTANRLRITH
jgi:hypothetical protein